MRWEKQNYISTLQFYKNPFTKHSKEPSPIVYTVCDDDDDDDYVETLNVQYLSDFVLCCCWLIKKHPQL